MLSTKRGGKEHRLPFGLNLAQTSYARPCPRVHTFVFCNYINHIMTEDRYYDSIITMDFIKCLLYAGIYPWKSAFIF